MKRMICGLSVLAVMACWTVVPAWAQSGEHKMVKAKELKWADVPSLPKGAQAVVIEGPMNEAVPFTIRIKFPPNYKLPAHWHPAVERVTVLSGEFHMGIGEKFDEKKVMGVKAGDMMIMQPKTPHYALTKTATVVQVHGTGPWAVNYVNPDDDPRKKK
jgi:quercetin dioxygenase-like cupin family protein